MTAPDRKHRICLKCDRVIARQSGFRLCDTCRKTNEYVIPEIYRESTEPLSSAHTLGWPWVREGK